MKKLLLILCLGLLTAGCSSKNPFLGKWYAVDGKDLLIVSFEKDEKCNLKVVNKESISCTYTYDDEKITIVSKGKEIEIEYVVGKSYLMIGEVKLHNSIEKAEEYHESIANQIVKLVEIPDLENLDLKDAKKILEEKELVIAEVIEENNDDIPKGNVIKTNPEAGRKVKEKSDIILYVSSGPLKYVVEDYTGKNYIEIKNLLEVKYGIIVTVEELDYSSDNSFQIISQSVKEGEILKKGDSIILYVSSTKNYYPDFVNDGFNIDDIYSFADLYDLDLEIIYEETDFYESGVIISQSKVSGSEVKIGDRLKIVIAK